MQWACCVALVSLIACGGKGPVPRMSAGTDADMRFANAIWLIADSQLHNFAGLQDTSRYKDATVSVAIRPPTLDLWAETLLSRVMERVRAEPHPTLFVGDAANSSCLGEFYRFLHTMGVDESAPPWFAVIGNHDGYYMGNLVQSGDRPSDWSEACRFDAKLPADWATRLATWESELLGAGDRYTEQSILSKALAVAMYLQALYSRKVITVDPLDPANWSGGPFRRFIADGAYTIAGRTRRLRVVAEVADKSTTSADCRSEQREARTALAKKSDKQIVRDVEEARIACSTGWRAFVTQDLELEDDSHAVLVDTSDFVQMPAETYYAFRNGNPCNLPGVCGRIDARQTSLIAEMIDSHSNAFFLVGHHHWGGLSVDGASSVRPFMKFDRGSAKGRFMTYISAHTHDPTATMAFHGAHQWELNVASTTDWPLEFARVAYNTDPPGQAYHDLKVDVYPVFDGAIDDNSCPLSPKTGNDLFDELNYFGPLYAFRAIEQYRRLRERLMQPPPSGAPCDAFAKLDDVDSLGPTGRAELLRDLAACDRDMLRRDAAVLSIERACAAWASRAEQYYYVGKVRRIANFLNWLRGKAHLQQKQPASYGRRLDVGETIFRVPADAWSR